jgi:hypothetical protein
MAALFAMFGHCQSQMVANFANRIRVEIKKQNPAGAGKICLIPAQSSFDSRWAWRSAAMVSCLRGQWTVPVKTFLAEYQVPAGFCVLVRRAHKSDLVLAVGLA